MKTDREFVDAVYEKYGRTRTEEKRKEAARRRRFRYIGTLAACIILFVGIIGVTQLKDRISPDMGGDAQEETVLEDTEKSSDSQGLTASNPEATNDAENNEDDKNYTVTDPEPFMTDQGLVNEVVGKAGSIKGIEVTRTSGSTYESKFFTDAADISKYVDWLNDNSGFAMSEATFYSNFDSSNMPETYYVMSAQFSADPADSIDVYVVTDNAPGF